ncbi:MAG: ATP-binding protein [Nannocystaceae bacterium]
MGGLFWVWRVLLLGVWVASAALLALLSAWAVAYPGIHGTVAMCGIYLGLLAALATASVRRLNSIYRDRRLALYARAGAEPTHLPPVLRKVLVETRLARASIEGLDDGAQAARAAWEWIQTIRRLDAAGVRARTKKLSLALAEREQTQTEHRNVREPLRQAQKLESLGTLAGGIAHDFNNLLTVMEFNLHTLLAEPTAPGSRAAIALQEIQDASRSAAALTAQILAFGRKQALQRRTIDLNEVIEHALTLLRRTIGEQYELDFISGSQLGCNYADSQQLDQVLMNLCFNARDAMPGGGRITLETENVVVNGEYTRLHPWAKKGRYILLTVSDNGVGMVPEVSDRIFEPFFTTQGLGRGTGLGLATVYGIVRQHDGMIHVHSEPGQGTVFKIYLPHVERSAVAVERKPPAVGPHGHEHILVAEDEPGIRRAVSCALEDADYSVRSAEDGEAAWEIFRANPTAFDLILVDAVMPKLSGPELIGRMRERLPALRCLMMSGYRDTAGDRPTDRWLTKPFQPADLLQAIRQILDA